MASFISNSRLPEFGLWKKIANRRIPLDFYLEITARCNNNCRHCYINLPAKDPVARQSELSLAEINNIADQAVEMGALWCLLTGGEPLLRRDFKDIYLSLKRKGLLVSLFTNACLVSKDHVALFNKYRPHYIEVTVYGVTQETYESVTRTPGSFAAFQHGLDLLLSSGVKVKLKAMALRSNVHELPEISAFCCEHSSETFRFDPLLHLRYDQNPLRNAEIRSERLSPAEIVVIEQADDERSEALQKHCDKFIFQNPVYHDCDHLFRCGAGNSSFTVSYDGIFRLCADLWHPNCICDLREGTLAEAWNDLVPRVRDMRSINPDYLDNCRNCHIGNLCMWCPAHAYLETGIIDRMVPYFCDVAHARAKALEESLKSRQ